MGPDKELTRELWRFLTEVMTCSRGSYDFIGRTRLVTTEIGVCVLHKHKNNWDGAEDAALALDKQAIEDGACLCAMDGRRVSLRHYVVHVLITTPSRSDDVRPWRWIADVLLSVL